jgi:two-component system response regulator AlgR
VKCLVVDDEFLARQRLCSLVDELEGWEICGDADSGDSALREVERLRPDVVLLDIRMPGMDGLETARHITALESAPAVIFTTAYGDHALEAFDAQAVDYLLKPIHPDRLAQALDKARRLSAAQLEQIQDPGAAGARTHICARNRGNLEILPVNRVLYFQADSKYVTVRAPDQAILVEESLKSLEQEFSERFIRVHRNALVAVDAIRGLEKDSDGRCAVVLEGVDERLEVSRRLLPEVRRRIRKGV